ncbi:MAG: acyclic terpene utilization AtuA family protein, partial [Lentisphaerae bacterium]|nr:acyclic terpene utilization AtuA family protein [Lentisphaerota bacterium]
MLTHLLKSFWILAYPIWKGFDAGLSLHCAKIAECGALCAYPVGANDSLLCTLSKNHFIVEPVNLARKCTPESVAGHSLYEQPNPECFYEPEGMIDMRQSKFEQISSRTVKVSGTVLRVPEQQTLKLEGAELKGYRTVTIAGTCDPMVIARIDELESGVRKAVDGNLKGIVAKNEYQLIFRRYGLDASTFVKPANPTLPHEVGLMIEVIALTQKLADNILS